MENKIKVGDVFRIEGLFQDHRGQYKFLKKGKYKGDKLTVTSVYGDTKAMLAVKQ